MQLRACDVVEDTQDSRGRHRLGGGLLRPNLRSLRRKAYNARRRSILIYAIYSLIVELFYTLGWLRHITFRARSPDDSRSLRSGWLYTLYPLAHDVDAALGIYWYAHLRSRNVATLTDRVNCSDVKVDVQKVDLDESFLLHDCELTVAATNTTAPRYATWISRRAHRQICLDIRELGDTSPLSLFRRQIYITNSRPFSTTASHTLLSPRSQFSISPSAVAAFHSFIYFYYSVAPPIHIF